MASRSTSGTESFAPKDTPAAVVQKLSAALKAAVKDPEVMKRFSDINTVPVNEDRATPEAVGQIAHQRDRALGAGHQGSQPVRRLNTSSCDRGDG